MPIVRVRDIRNGRVRADSPHRVSAAVEADYARSRLAGGELLLTLVGTVGEAAVAGPDLASWNVARAVGVARIRSDVGARWLTWALQAPPARAFIAERLNTTVQATFNLSDLRGLPVPLPPPAERKAIAATLGALDDKIESNRRLLHLQRDLMLASLAELEMRYPQKLPLAAGYSVGLSGVWGADVPSGRDTESVLCLRGRDLEDYNCSVMPNAPRRHISAKQKLSREWGAGEIWTAGSGTLGPSLLLTSSMKERWSSTLTYSNFVKRLVPNGRLIPEVAWLAVVRSADAGLFQNFRTGTAMPNLSAEAMLAGIQVPDVPIAAVGRLCSLVQAYLEPHRRVENTRLAALRDALLPELLSGRLRASSRAG